MIGKTISHYRVTEMLGADGMEVAWRCELGTRGRWHMILRKGKVKIENSG